MAEKGGMPGKKAKIAHPVFYMILPLVLILVLSSCSGPSKDEDHKIFRYNEASGISSLDPAFARNLSNIWGSAQVFNGLVQLDDEMKIRPCIASHWKVSDNGKEYRFFLRDDVYFHHDPELSGERGRKVVADDFVFSFRRIIDPETSSPGAWVFNELARDSNGSPAVFADDDTTLVIRLKRAFPPFLGILTMPYCSVVLPEAVEKYGQDFRKNPVGTGPFRFKYWKEGVKLVLRRNPWYFEEENGVQLPYLEAVSISFVIDKQAAFLEFVKGELDFMSGIDPSYKDELLTAEGKLNPAYTGKVRLLKQPYLNTEYLGFMLDGSNLPAAAEPVDDVRVRQAINYGFDRRKMIRFLRNNIGTPGTGGFIPDGLPGADTARNIGYSYDPAKARELLREAGYPGGEGLPKISLATSSEYLDLCKYIQHELSQIGISLSIDVSPPAALKEMKAQAKLPFFRGSWIADYPDAENYLSLFHSSNFCPEGPNYFHFSRPAFDSLYAASLETLDEKRRAGIYHHMDSLIMASAPVVVLYYDEVLRFVASGITGLGSNPVNRLNLKRVRKIKD